MSRVDALIGGQASYRYPYPGLRPFEKEESDLFFGREGQVDELLARLRRRRFLAVTGPSGCGKSSLIRAGLIPALEAGAMIGGGLNWRIAVMRPGDRPMFELSRALLASGAFGERDPESEDQVAPLRATLERGSLGLVEALREPDPRRQGANLLLLVDQFEEIFRYQRSEPGEARAFVDLLIASASDRGSPAYVVITLRTDHLGNCPIFPGLPEMMNDSQFLTPRLTREQCKAAVVGPAEWMGAEVAPEVVSLILNEMGTDPDQLPLMQHLLMRMWREAAPRGAAAEVHPPDEPVRLTREHYDSAGGLAGALNKHADRIFDRLGPDRLKVVAERMFRCLTEVTPDNNKIRRPTAFAEICRAVGATATEVASVVDAFRAEGRCLLTPPLKSPSEPLRADAVIDISHESLIRQWKRLEGWTEDEDQVRKAGREARDRARTWAAKGRPEDGLLAGLQLTEVERWAEGHPYELEVRPLVAEFLQASRDRRDREISKARYWKVGLTTLACASLLLAVAAGLSSYNANSAKAEAERLLDRMILIDSQRYARKSASALNTSKNPEAALLMAIEGGKVLQKRKDGEKDPTPEIESALRRAIEAAGAPAPKWVFESHASGVDSVALSRDGHWLVIASRDGEIRLWDLKQDRPSFESLRINKPPGQPLRTAISLDGGWLIAVAGRMPILYDLQDLDRLPRAPVVLEELGGATVDLTFSPTSNRLAIADDGGTVRVWELGREGRPAARPVIDFAERGRAACDLAFSYDGRHLASGDTDGRTRVWDLEAPARAPLILGEQVGPILDVDFAGDGRVAAVGGDNRIALWNLHAPGRPCLVLDPPSTEAFTAVEFDPEGRWMASGAASGSVFLWDLGGLKEAAVPVATLRGLPGLVTDLVFSKDVDRAGGLWLAAATSPGASGRTSALWDVSAAGSAAIGAPCLKLEGGAAVVLAFESAGDWLALGGADGAVRLYDLDGFNPARRDEVFAEYGASRAAMAHEKPGRDLAISPDGASLAVAGDDGRVGLWSIDKPSTPPRLLQAGSGRSVRDVAFSPDGRWLAAWSVEESAALGMTSGCAVLLCDLRKGSGPGSMSDPFRRDVGRIDAPELPPLPHSLAFAPGGGWFASGGGEALLWDLAGADPAKSARPIAGSGAVASLDFSPDGRWLAVGDLGGIVTLYGGRAGWGRPEQGRVVTRHGGAVIAAMFTPDGRLITAGRDGTVRLLPAAADGPPAGGGALPAFDLRGPIESVAMGVCQGRPRLAVGDLQGRIYLFDLGPQDSSLPIPDPAVGSSGALALAFSPDGSRLATGRENGLIDVYALDEGGNARELVSFQHERAVTSLTFSADGRRIVSASADGTVRTWPLVPSTDLLKLAETLAQRNPTADEWKRYIDANFQDFHKTAEKLPVHPSLVASVFQLAGEGRTKEARDRLRMLRDIDPGLAVTEDHLDAEAERARVRAQVQQVRTQLRRVVARLAEEVMGKVDVARGAGPVVGNDAAARARESQELARYLKGFHLDADYIRRQQALAWVEQALALELRRKHHDLALMFYERASERDPKINLDLAAIRSRLADSSRRGTPLQLHESGYQSAAKGDVEEAP